MRLKRKLSYAVVTPGPVCVVLKKFRTKARCKRYCKANKIKFYRVFWYQKKRKRKRNWNWWIPEIPNIQIQEMVQEYITLQAQDLSDQLLRVQNQLVLKMLDGTDYESLWHLFSTTTSPPAGEPSLP